MMHRQEDARKQVKNRGLSSEMGLEWGGWEHSLFLSRRRHQGLPATTQHHVGLLFPLCSARCTAWCISGCSCSHGALANANGAWNLWLRFKVKLLTSLTGSTPAPALTTIMSSSSVGPVFKAYV